MRVEQAILGITLIIGNKVALVHGGETPCREMFSVIHNARDDINVESGIIEDDEVARAIGGTPADRCSFVYLNNVYLVPDIPLLKAGTDADQLL